MKNIAKALAQFHKEMGTIQKSANNPFFKSKYAPLEVILPAIKEPLEKAGLVFYQSPTYLWWSNIEQGINQNMPALKTVLIHVESGAKIEDTLPLILAKQDPQGVGRAITYMRRYALVAMLGLNCDEDDDGNASVKQRETSKTAQGKAKSAESTETIYETTDVPF